MPQVEYSKSILRLLKRRLDLQHERLLERAEEAEEKALPKTADRKREEAADLMIEIRELERLL